jgi:hypothetical protein
MQAVEQKAARSRQRKALQASLRTWQRVFHGMASDRILLQQHLFKIAVRV